MAQSGCRGAVSTRPAACGGRGQRAESGGRWSVLGRSGPCQDNGAAGGQQHWTSASRKRPGEHGLRSETPGRRRKGLAVGGRPGLVRRRVQNTPAGVRHEVVGETASPSLQL